MESCEGCGVEFEPRNSRHRFCSKECRTTRRRPVAGLLREALERTIEALPTSEEHHALTQSCRALADVIDQLEGFDDKAWREYRLALKELREAVAGGGSPSDNFLPADWLEQGRATVGDSPVA